MSFLYQEVWAIPLDRGCEARQPQDFWRAWYLDIRVTLWVILMGLFSCGEPVRKKPSSYFVIIGSTG
jgi:hypothetical protein